MNDKEFVQDDEELYRSVRGDLKFKEYSVQDGKLRIESAAFMDRCRKPSVDRAKLQNFDPDVTNKRLPVPPKGVTNGVVSLTTGEVRTAIGDVHAVDVVPEPTPQNPAHAIIAIVNLEHLESESKQKNAFRLLRIALATLANKNGCIKIEPKQVNCAN